MLGGLEKVTWPLTALAELFIGGGLGCNGQLKNENVWNSMNKGKRSADHVHIQPNICYSKFETMSFLHLIIWLSKNAQ